MTFIARAVLAAALTALLLLAPGAAPVALAQAADGRPAVSAGPDYSAWEKIAMRAEGRIEDPETGDEVLRELRAQIADWRTALQSAQSTNSSRIAILRTQIDALGPAPAEGETESPDIALRRTELSAELAQLQAPGIAADEAYRRADGLIREIDRLLRERQASELMQLWPSPLNPANWPAAASAISGSVEKVAEETGTAWQNPVARAELQGNLPLILAYLAFALGLIWRAPGLMARLAARVGRHSSDRWRVVWSHLISLGQIVVPMLGVLALWQALKLTEMTGPALRQIVDLIPMIGIVVLTANWLGGRIFPAGDSATGPFHLPPEERAEGRLYALSFGLLIGVDLLRRSAVDLVDAGEAARSVTGFPILLLASLLVFRIGNLLRRHVANDSGASEVQSFRNGLIGLMGRAARIIAIIAPVLAAIGYVPAAAALVHPAAMSLALFGLIFILQQLIDNIYALLIGQKDGEDALLPVLIGFVLSAASLPLFALIWGARWSDLTELWTTVSEGFAIGDTRISPTAFLVFAAVFAIGYMATRLVQGALRSSVLPRTRLDQGGRNAILSGIGYIGIFLSGLVAINSAGIDLSGIAIVAGALSVGIGFGLQNIVSNFVSGIILLIERPVSEGDWIEVGGVQGTVRSISVRSTRIQTFDRTDVIVPNSDLVSGQVTNWTRFNLTGRLIVPVGVAYGSDTREVERILQDIAEAEPLAVLNPPPMVVFMGFTPDAMNFEIRIILRDVNFSLNVRSEMNHQIVQRFAEAGISMPFIQREVRLQRTTDRGQHPQPASHRTRDEVPPDPDTDAGDAR